MSKLDKKYFGIILIGIIALSLIGLFVSTQPSQDKIILGINPFPLSALVFIADEKGYFAQEGLNVEFVNFQTGKLALDSLLGGGTNIATTADIPITLAALSDQEFSVVSTIAWGNDISVVARKDSGIIVPADLKGKRIGTTSGGGPLFFTHKFLETNNISVEDVSLTYLSPSDMVLAIVRGDLDAIIVFSPHPSFAKEQLGDNAVIFSPENIYGETWNVVVSKEFVINNPESVLSFLKALKKAELFAENNRDEAITITAQRSGVKASVLESYWDILNFELALNNILTDSLILESKWAIDTKISNALAVPDFNEFIDSSFLDKINN